MIYFIQGIFYQNNSWMDVKAGRPAIVSGLLSMMYSGVLGPDPENPGRLAGSMMDVYGDSILSDVVYTPNELQFTKTYSERNNGPAMRYSFRELGGRWVGTYDGEQVGSGISWCLLKPVEESFFDCKQLTKLLGKSTAHTWGKGRKERRKNRL